MDAPEGGEEGDCSGASVPCEEGVEGKPAVPSSVAIGCEAQPVTATRHAAKQNSTSAQRTACLETCMSADDRGTLIGELGVLNRIDDAASCNMFAPVLCVLTLLKYRGDCRIQPLTRQCQKCVSIRQNAIISENMRAC